MDRIPACPQTNLGTQSIQSFDRLFICVALAAVLLIFTAHFLFFAQIPSGYFHDESAVGYNALLLSQSFHDEHGTFAPVFIPVFETTFLDPIMVYATTALFRLVGEHAWVPRAAAACFFALTIFLHSVLIQRLFRQKSITLLSALLFVSLPWYWTFSRLGFSAISLPPLLAGFFLCMQHATSENSQSGRWYFLTGLTLAFLAYTYPAGRILALLLFPAAIISVQLSRRTFIPYQIFGFFLGLLPIAAAFHSLLALQNFFARFREVTYLNDNASLLCKAFTFVHNYLLHFSPRFLFISGDPNLRHGLGIGELSITVACLGLLSTFLLTRKFSTPARSLAMLVFYALLSSPIPAAITSEALPHAVRSIAFGYCAVLFASWGLAACAHSPKILWIVLTIAFLEGGHCAYIYYSRYPRLSAEAFDSQGLELALPYAAARSSNVEVSTAFEQEHRKYFSALIHRSVDAPSILQLTAGSCVVATRHDAVLQDESLSISEKHFRKGTRVLCAAAKL